METAWRSTPPAGRPRYLQGAGRWKRQGGIARGRLPDSWTPDGKTLLYESTAPARIWIVSVSAPAGDSKPRMLSEPSPFNEAQAQVSPDGRWMAYVSDESGKSQVYARPFPGPGK